MSKLSGGDSSQKRGIRTEPIRRFSLWRWPNVAPGPQYSHYTNSKGQIIAWCMPQIYGGKNFVGDCQESLPAGAEPYLTTEAQIAANPELNGLCDKLSVDGQHQTGTSIAHACYAYPLAACNFVLIDIPGTIFMNTPPGWILMNFFAN